LFNEGETEDGVEHDGEDKAKLDKESETDQVEDGDCGVASDPSAEVLIDPGEVTSVRDSRPVRHHRPPGWQRDYV